MKLYIIFSLLGATVFSTIIAYIIVNMSTNYNLSKEEDTNNDDKEYNEVIVFIRDFLIRAAFKNGSYKFQALLCKLFCVPYVKQHIYSICKQFGASYCWHFAHMMKDTFNRGTVCWEAPFSHFVWVDEDCIGYDIYGKINENGYTFLIPEDMIPEKILSNYIHVKETNKIETQEYLDIMIQYANQHNLTFNREYVSGLIDNYINGNEIKLLKNVKEMSEIREV